MTSSRIPQPITLDDDALDPEETSSGPAWSQGVPWGPRAFRHHVLDAYGSEPAPQRIHILRVSTPINYELLVDDLTVRERFVPSMYLCTEGRVTVGVGNMMPTVEPAKLLPFTNTSTGQPATDAEIQTAYDAVSGMAKGQHWPKYKIHPSLEITELFARELAIKRLKREFPPQICKRFPDFDSYPESAQRFMVDMAYNGGAGYFAKRHMVSAIQNRDWLGCIPCVPPPVNPKHPDRKLWRINMLQRAAVEDA